MLEHELVKSLPSALGDLQTGYDISLVIPTRNEAGNIEPLLMRIHQAVKGIATEVVFVDDSTDNTPEVIRKLQEWFPLPIKLIHRPKEMRKNGLGGAVVEGFKATQAKWMCVMDADLQHPPEMIPRLYPAGTEEWGRRCDGQPAGAGWGCQQPGLHPHGDLVCLCLDDALDVSAAAAEGDRSADGVLHDAAGGGRTRRS